MRKERSCVSRGQEPGLSWAGDCCGQLQLISWGPLGASEEHRPGPPPGQGCSGTSTPDA